MARILAVGGALVLMQALSAQQEATQLDLDGKGAAARALFQKMIDTTEKEAARAAALRGVAMSWAFEGNCAKTAEYEEMVIHYWATRESEEPQNAFYQQGEMANEAARVCLDTGNLDTALSLYRRGRDLGLKQPNLAPDRKSLWEYRWEHAQARIAARRGNRKEAEQHAAAAQTALSSMTQLQQQQQQPFYPFLLGYVAFYLGDYPEALANLSQANQNDPSVQVLLGQTYEKLNDTERAREYYRKAAGAKAHNPPAAYAHWFTKDKFV